jgi:hypothetical protein
VDSATDANGPDLPTFGEGFRRALDVMGRYRSPLSYTLVGQPRIYVQAAIDPDRHKPANLLRKII